MLKLTLFKGHVFLGLRVEGWVLNQTVYKHEKVLFDLGRLYLDTPFWHLYNLKLCILYTNSKYETDL